MQASQHGRPHLPRGGLVHRLPDRFRPRQQARGAGRAANALSLQPDGPQVGLFVLVRAPSSGGGRAGRLPPRVQWLARAAAACLQATCDAVQQQLAQGLGHVAGVPISSEKACGSPKGGEPQLVGVPPKLRPTARAPASKLKPAHASSAGSGTCSWVLPGADLGRRRLPRAQTCLRACACSPAASPPQQGRALQEQAKQGQGCRQP